MVASGVYRPHLCDAGLAHRLQVAGAALVESTRACSKMATARQGAVSEVLLEENGKACRSALPAHLWHYGPCVRCRREVPHAA